MRTRRHLTAAPMPARSAFPAVGMAPVAMVAVAMAVLTSCTLLQPQPAAPAGDRYLVFFETNSAELDPNAVTVVDKIAAGARSARPDAILIRGYADRRGRAGDNARLSDERAQAVAQALLERGIEAQRLRTQAFGESSMTGDAASESGDRRVEVLFQPLP